MSTPDELREALRADADAADNLDRDAIWARVTRGIHRRRRRRRAAALTGAAAAAAAVALSLPALDRDPLPPASPPVATTSPAPVTPSEDATDAPSGGPTQVPPEVLVLPTTEPRATTDGTVAWVLPEQCAIGAPSTATAMVTVRDGTGEFEAPIDVQQVALFADAATAVTEADRVRQALAGCGAGSDLVTTEASDVGAQGVEVSRVYGDDQGGPTPFGTYTVLTRRGSAIALVTIDGGDGSPESARDPVVERARQVWENLCGYDSAGC